jgi:glycine hydroxymethyltransferase
VIAGKAVAFGEALDDSFKTYCAQVLKNANAMAERLQERGLDLVSGGTDNHLMLIDLSDRDVSGKDAEIALGMAGITVNKNTVPKERRSPMVTSGIRVGTPAVTTRGMGVEESKWIADRIADVIENHSNGEKLASIKNDVHDLCGRFPIYPDYQL